MNSVWKGNICFCAQQSSNEQTSTMNHTKTQGAGGMCLQTEKTQSVFLVFQEIYTHARGSFAVLGPSDRCLSLMVPLCCWRMSPKTSETDNGRMGRTLCLHKSNKDIQWHIHVWFQHLANNYNLLASFFILFACLTVFSFFRFWRRNLRCQKQRLFQAYLTMPLFRFWDKPSFCTSTADQLFLQPTEAVGNSLKLLIEARTTASCSAVHCSSQLNSCQSQLGAKWKHLYH